MANRKSKIENSQSAAEGKAWRFFHWYELFEKGVDTRYCRQGGLFFIRAYVLGDGKDESQIFVAARNRIRAMKEGHLLEACMTRLIEFSASRKRSRRGWLLGDRDEPAPNRQLAFVMGIDPRKVRTVLAVLEAENILERATLPEFDPRDDLPPEEQDQTTKDTKDTKGGRGRKKSKIENRKSKIDRTETDDGAGETAEGSAPVEPAPDSIDEEAMLQEALRRGREKGYASRFGQLVADMQGRAVHSPAAADFAGEIFRALFACSPREGYLPDAQETGCFAAAYDAACAYAGANVTAGAIAPKALKLAVAVRMRAERAKKIRNRGAYWRTCFAGLVSSMAARASPAAGGG